MWTALAMTAALSFAPAQPGELALTNVRPTAGLFGPTRKDADAPKVLPGDVLFFSFDIENLKVLEDGRVRYGVGLVWTNKDGKEVYSEEPLALEIIPVLGGTRVPGFISAGTDPSTPPGEYTLTAVVLDRVAKVEKKVSRKFEILPPGFGIVQLRLTYDLGAANKAPTPAPPVAVPGQQLFISCATPGFERDKATKQPNLTFKVRAFLDGKLLPGKEQVATVKNAQEDVKMIPVAFPLVPTRPGKYTVEVEVNDEVSRKKATQTVDIQVVEVK